MKNWLAIDTSTDVASVALWYKGELTSMEQGNQKTHAQFLLPMIDALLANSGAALNQMDAIVFGRGPGSFTGLRIACATAKGLAIARDIEVIPVSTLAAIVHATRAACQKTSDLVLAMVDARMQEVYWGWFDSETHTAEEHVSAVASITADSDASFILAGVGVELFKPLLDASIQSRIQSILPIYPSASAMIALARETNIRSIPAAMAEPVYVRNKVTQGG